MKSLKKVALASAAALAFAGLSVAANAAPLTVTVAGVANATTSLAPQTVAVPTSNVIDNTNSVALAATADTGTVVTFTASGVKLVPALNSASAPVTSASGTTSYSATSQGSAITLYAFTTSTTTGSVTIVNGSYSTIVYIQGTAGVAANIALTVPSSVAVGTAPQIKATATDVFGNPVASETISVTLVGGTFSDGSSVKNLVTATKAAALADATGATVWGSATGTLSAVTAGSVTVVASDASIVATATGLPAAVKSASATFVVSDLNAQIVALNARIAALTSDLATAKADLATEKAGRAADKVAADKAATDAKTTSDKAIADAKAKYDALVKLYNAKAKKYKFTAIK